MRNIRRAALAGATALAVSLSGVVAHAEEPNNDNATTAGSFEKVQDKVKGALSSENKENENKDADAQGSFDKLKDKAENALSSSKKDDEGKDKDVKPADSSSLSSQIGDKLNDKDEYTGRQVYGSTTDSDVKGWAKVLQVGSIASVIGALLGLVIFPAYNFLKFNGFIR
ncbi:hypothetical protein C1Y63_11215 [Corynebacterium sp. 13CS0277]|uniref:hypothetical protein n=1 Tax=Corynebacterium sp. 13CS0277 TaxID=2071994 RepID=UPI000D037CEF|nr:hypothetical protein [Corynebacterium sp. 13CS0277]PRQ10496.1 hypothetical protein C1Y63_11215 [Corynebacterium sp. 13CS0277]